MSSYIILAVGIICKKDSFLAVNAPESINVWSVSESDVIVGTSYKKEFSDEHIEITELFNASDVFSSFDSFKKAYKQLIRASDFKDDEQYKNWVGDFDVGRARIVFVHV